MNGRERFAAAGNAETRPARFVWNRRMRTLVSGLAGFVLLLALIAGSALLPAYALDTNLAARSLSPDWRHLFGTDWLGRDMFIRTIKGLSLSIGVGLIASGISVVIALILGIASATMGRWMDSIVTWLVDLFLGIPHMVAIILIAVVFGGGAKGIIIGIAVTHWTSLARIVRAEVMQLRSSHFVQISRHFGRSKWWVATRHILPHLLPQILVGGILMFPHAILHEAAVTFLGFGLSPHQPAIGVILSESMQHLASGMWWLAFFPGLCLLALVRAFDIIGNNLRLLIDPHKAHE